MKDPYHLSGDGKEILLDLMEVAEPGPWIDEILDRYKPLELTHRGGSDQFLVVFTLAEPLAELLPR